ncbi:MAG: hypothetical protein NTU91_12515 [Chloroflexi bacterium]|nr:hypothetical protein [Chloroflexota bacterium]
MTTRSVTRSCLRPSPFAILAVLCAISLSCSTLTGLVPTAGVETAEPGVQQGETPLEAGEAPAVLGYVLDPDGAPVAFASVAGEIADSNGAVSGDLTGSASGWLEVNALGYATGYAKPGEGIGKTAIFEARLTPFEAFLPLESGDEVVFTLGDVAQPVAEVSIPAGAVSSLPAYVEAAVYDRGDVGPYLAELDSGEALDLKLALAVEATSDQLEPVSLASGKTLALKLFPNASLPADPVMAIFDPEKGIWEVQAGACTPGEAGALLCAIPHFSPLIGLFGPSDEVGQRPDSGVGVQAAPAARIVAQFFSDDQAYQDAMTDVEVWAWIGQGQMERTGTVSAEWEAEMANRVGKWADAAEAYAESHPDKSGLAHLLYTAQAALKLGMDPAIADKLMKDAREIAEAAAEALLEEGDCGRIREMLMAARQLMLLGGSQAIADALIEKANRVSDCDIWDGTIHVWLLVASNPPRLDWALESGGGDWWETHNVTMTTNVQTYVLKGEDRVTLKGMEVTHGKKDRHGCHTYMTHNLDVGGGPIFLNFDGRYDGYTFTVGDLKSAGGSSSIIYGAHGERWNDEEEKCEVIDDQSAPAPNYTSVLLHGFSGSPPITMQEMLQSGDNTAIGGLEEISNGAYELFIFPVEHGYVEWRFHHTKKGLPQK